MNKITSAEAKQASIQMRKELEVKFLSNQLSLVYDKINQSSHGGYLHCEYPIPSGNVNTEGIIAKIESILKEDGFIVSHRDSTSHLHDYVLSISWS
jgi:hypothetical protein